MSIQLSRRGTGRRSASVFSGLMVAQLAMAYNAWAQSPATLVRRDGPIGFYLELVNQRAAALEQVDAELRITFRIARCQIKQKRRWSA